MIFILLQDTEVGNIVIGFYKPPDRNTQNAFFFGLIKSSSCKGADIGKREIEKKKNLKERSPIHTI